jgi:hypothetical protein
MGWVQSAIDDVERVFSLGWVGSIIGIVGIAYAIFAYFRTRQRGIIKYTQSGERMLGLTTDGLPRDVTVQYCGNDIQRLTRTIIWLWNAGEKTFKGSDIPAHDHLRLEVKNGGSVLAATVLKQARDVCRFAVPLDAESPDKVLISFDFLDPKDGAVLEVLHTSEEIDIDVCGTVVGLPSGPKELGALPKLLDMPLKAVFVRALNLTRRTLPIAIIFAGLALAITGMFASSETRLLAEKVLPPPTKDLNRSFFIFAGFLYSLTGFFLLYLGRRRYPKSLHIDGLLRRNRN